METDKKHQHYVWKNYLKPWATNNNIWCKRHDSIFKVSLNNIAQEKYFYEVNPLNEIEIRILTRFIEMNPIENRPFLVKKFAQYIYICNSNDEYLKKNAIEEYHARIENSIGSALEYLYKKDLSFLNDYNSKVNFFYFVSLQYHRTKTMREKAVTGLSKLPVSPPKEIEGMYDNRNIIMAYSLLLDECIANWMIEKTKIYFIETDYEFIASDQPIINIHSNNEITFEPVKEMEYYYPISPHLAVFITKKNIHDRKIGKTETDEYNKLIYTKSHEQVYAFSREVLVPFSG
jgi:hypothetical protein